MACLVHSMACPGRETTAPGGARHALLACVLLLLLPPHARAEGGPVAVTLTPAGISSTALVLVPVMTVTPPLWPRLPLAASQTGSLQSAACPRPRRHV